MPEKMEHPNLAILLVTFSGWLSDPFKGCWWPPTRGKKGHGLNHLECKIGFLQLQTHLFGQGYLCSMPWCHCTFLTGGPEVPIGGEYPSGYRNVDAKKLSNLLIEKPMKFYLSEGKVHEQILTAEIPSRQTSPYPTKRHSTKIITSSNFVP